MTVEVTTETCKLLGTALVPAGATGGEMLSPQHRMIPLERIHPDPDQPRRSVATSGPEWEGLVASIREVGVLQPVLLRPGPGGEQREYVLVCGERRWRAASAAGLSHIPARIIKSPALLARTIEIQLVENALREDLFPLDETEACVRLLATTRMRRGVLARRLGVSNALVTEILKLDAIAPEVRAGIRESGRRFSRRQLLQVALHNDIADQRRVLARLLGETPGDPGQAKASMSPAAITPDEITGPGFRCALDLTPGPGETQADREAGGIDVVIRGAASRECVVRLLRRLADHLAYELEMAALYRRCGVATPPPLATRRLAALGRVSA